MDRQPTERDPLGSLDVPMGFLKAVRLTGAGLTALSLGAFLLCLSRYFWGSQWELGRWLGSSEWVSGAFWGEGDWSKEWFVGVSTVTIAVSFLGAYLHSAGGRVAKSLSHSLAAARSRKHEKARERMVLESAQKREGLVAALDVAMDTKLTVADCEGVLKALDEDGHVRTEVAGDGSMVYVFERFVPRQEDVESEVEPGPKRGVVARLFRKGGGG